MSCEILSDWSKKDCANNGGLVALVIGGRHNVASYDLDGQEIDAIEMLAGTQCYKVLTDVDSAKATYTATRSRENNTVFIAQTIMAILKDDDMDTSELTEVLAKGFFIVIAMYANGKNRVYGLLNGMTAETIVHDSGQKYEDPNGSTVNFVGKELIQPPYISTALVESLLVPVS